MEEPEPDVSRSADRHEPTTGKSQDISQILADTFKNTYTRDIIGKDTLSNLDQTKTGQSSYREEHAEELRRARSDYQRRVAEADMLESSITQALAQAAAKEGRAYKELTENVGDFSDHPGLFTVKSAFWCPDEDLLRRNNLISPRDYLPTQKPRSRAPAAVKSSLVKPTLAYVTHTSRDLQDGGLAPNPKRTMLETGGLDVSLTFDSSSDIQTTRGTPEEKPNRIKSRPKRSDPSLRGPRFLPALAHQGPKARPKRERKASEDPRNSPADERAPVFQAKPQVIIFSDYAVGQVYESTLELTNVTNASCHVRVVPPATPYFSIGLGRFPGDGGVVAPGLSCRYTLRFTPDSLGNYEDFVVVESPAAPQLLVPVEAWRPPPILTLPRVLDCGNCLVGGVKFVEFRCQNVGLSSGSFYVAPKDQWPNSNLRSVSRTYFSEQPPFAVGPSLLVLQPGEVAAVEVVFFPTAAEKSRRLFTVVCDNCQVKDISIEGEGHIAAPELVRVSGQNEPLQVGEVHDLTAGHFVRFGPCSPHSVQRKTLVVRNNIHLELPFYWQIMKPNLHPVLPGEAPESSHIHFHPAADDVFHISPASGVLGPGQDHEFHLTFSPKELEDYHSVCHLVLIDVPQLLPEPSESSFLQLLQTGYKVRDVVTMEIEVKGSTEPYHILLEPYAVVIPGEISMGAAIRRPFKMWNHSKQFASFQWEKLENSCYTMEVEPSAGRIENECFDFDLILTGRKPEKVETALICNIQHHHQPVILPVEVSFKGPTVTVSVPSVDFGLVRFGNQARTSLLLTNTTQLESFWTLEEKLHQPQDHRDTQIFVEPQRGALPPLASCDVELVFRPRFCQQLETELELTVEDGTGCHVWVRADVQSPRVCFLNSELVLSELYFGVPAKGSVTLFNQTLLPSRFSWAAELRGKQAPLCAASFEPSSGTLGPNESTEITVNLTAHADSELTEVAALCDVQGMNLPLVLAILASQPKKLCVSYSLPSDGPLRHDHNPSALALDFGDVTLKRAVTKQLLITNQTAIPAPFTIEAEYFTCHVLTPEKRSARHDKPLHSSQAEKAEAKAREEFVRSLLADGKGAAFRVLPESGLLGPFETLTVDVTAYNDMWGEYTDHLVCKVGELEPVGVLMMMTVKGCPLYFQMTGPAADDQFQGPVIHFGARMSGGDAVSRLLRINNPTMFDIRMDWETYNTDQNDRKLVDVLVSYGEHFPLKDADGNELLGGAPGLFGETMRERRRTPPSDGTSATDVAKREFVTEDEREEREESCLCRPPAKKNLISVHIRPHLGDLSDSPYCVTPRQTVIPAKSSGNVRVSFTPLTLSPSDGVSTCAGLALGFMSLDSETAVCIPGKVRRARGLDLEPVRVDLQAAVQPVVLLVQMDEYDGVLEFNASAGDLLRAESDEEPVAREFAVQRSVRLMNATETPLRFRLETQPPFSVLKPQASLVLHPHRAMQVKLAFHCSLRLLDHTDQAEGGVSPGARLIHTESGQEKLRFQQNLLIHYSNSSPQTVPLSAYLDLPALSLSADSLSFGFCYVGQTQTREIDLHSHGAHTYWKALTKADEGDPRVFRVTPDSGLLRPEKPPGVTCSQRLQVSFTPSGDGEFKAVVVFQSPLVKTPLTLQLQGSGSSDGVLLTIKHHREIPLTTEHVATL
ncbi:deleted in lung and esophageal cancer protein 1 isoform X2 [Kryptolebias marmoratus]|uniref:deleted in lung and esophageal cancer protein 1 isoform X2 n=1 Tax=Kryptolebias marmoratus TaxID=37003 RepID=UPI0018ACCD9D|nr:deleted in lung and esophageal cancer protein 1 isoform X2 [Kryptolebias marmoratus]